MIAAINQLLEQAKPFVVMVALLFGVVGAWDAVTMIVPIAGQIWSPKGDAQSYAIVGACLAIIAGNR